MKKILLILCGTLLISGAAFAKLTVAASIPDLASIAAYIGGDRVAVFSICQPARDPHTVEVLPSYMVKVSRADVYLKVGLSLDQWADGIVDGARNSSLRVVTCSDNVPVLEKPDRVDAYLAAQGDVHPQGNPHYWTNPDNGVIVARNIADGLIAADPAGATMYNDNLKKFEAEETSKMNEWKAAAAALPFHNIISYHSDWIYFADAFGFTIPAYVEPLPGIPPTPSHLTNLLNIIKSQQIKVIIQEPFYSDEAPNYLVRETGVKVVKISPSCADVSPASYFDHFQQIIGALQAVGG
jgi:zinc/manganese transport system substrate-binding protein